MSVLPHHSLGMVLFSMLCNFNKHLSLWFFSFPHNYEDICCKITTWCYVTISIIDTIINTVQDNAYHSVYYSINLFPNPPLLLTTTTSEFCIFLVETSLPLCGKEMLCASFQTLKTLWDHDENPIIWTWKKKKNHRTQLD